MKTNEKTIEEVTIENALTVIKNFEHYKKNKGPKPEGERTYIKVKYADKDKAKALGAFWDKDKKSWCFCENLDDTKKQKLLKYA